MTGQDLTRLDLYFFVTEDPRRGLSLVAIEAVTEGGRRVKVDAGSMSLEDATLMLPLIQSVSDRTGQRIYLVRCRFAELMTVVLPARGGNDALRKANAS